MGMHTATFKGKKILLILRTGEHVVGHFDIRTSRGVHLEEGRRIPVKQIARFIHGQGVMRALTGEGRVA